ncbi:MAG TPA: hypothetical protein VLE43_02055 [Candidatus Saccharimonadia bacterium]|nr:hypothetical protein [Candidatus Saccharimonadia bacterium]
MSFRLDHDGTVESEDPVCFQVCISEALAFFLVEKRRALRNLRDCSTKFGVPAKAIYEDILIGMITMLELVSRDQLAFWTNGDEECRLELLEAIRRHRLPREHPDHQEATHVRKERQEAKDRLQELHEPIYRSSALVDDRIMDRVHKFLRGLP